MLPTGLGRGATFSPFVPLLCLACICVPSRPTTQDDWGGASGTCAAPRAPLKWMEGPVSVSNRMRERNATLRLHPRFSLSLFLRLMRFKYAGEASRPVGDGGGV